MSSSAAKLFAIVAVVITVALAFGVYRMSRQYAASSQVAVPVETAAQPAVPRTLAVVALKPLSAYKAIGKDDVALVEVSVAPTDFYATVAEVVGKQPLVDVDAGAPVTKRYFGQGNVLARSIPPGFQAISVEINDVIAVGDFVRPGDIVDVLLYLRGNQGADVAQARVLLNGVRVLAYEDRLVDRPEGTTNADDKSNAAKTQARRTRTAVLAVAEADSTRLMLGASQGELRLALYGQPPAGQDAATPETLVAGGLPASQATLDAIAAGKVPDKALAIDTLARIKPPPSKQASAPVKVQVFRSSNVESVAVRP